jgi:uracil-DNA glycosylase family 4
MDPAHQLQKLAKGWHNCKRCDLHESRPGEDILFGSGPVPSDILLVGPHPSSTDEEQCSFFTEERGAILRELLNAVGLDIDDVFVTYVLGCRPKVIIPATEQEEERIDDRKPDKTEIASCRPRLNEIIYQVDPRIIITLGLMPLQLLATTGGKIRKIANAQIQLYETYVEGRIEPIRYPVMAALSMEFVVNNPSGAKHGPMSTTLEAFKRAAAYLQWIKTQEEYDE